MMSRIFIAGGVAFLLSLSSSLGQTGAFFRASGTNILDANGVPFLMRGNALSAWRTPEAYALRLNAVHARHLGSFSSMTNRILELLTNSAHAQEFWETYWSNYVDAADIADLAAEGFNTVRVPFNYRMLSPCGSPGTYDDAGFQVLSNVISWCKSNNIYVILDMHAAPGGQSEDTPADPEYTYWTLIGTNWWEKGVACLWMSNAEYYAATGRTPASNKQRTIDIWQEIATRFKNEKQIIGYEILNEPVVTGAVTVVDLRSLYTNITKAIRTVDTNHLILVTGTNYASYLDGLMPAWDSKLAFVFHKYWRPPTKAEVQQYLTFSTANSVPIIMGESGENSNPWFYEMRTMLESNHIGWCWWGSKKVDSINSAFSCNISTNYQYVIDNFRDNPTVDVARVRQGLMEMAHGMRTTNCVYEPGYFPSLIGTSFGTSRVPFVSLAWPGTVYAAYYDIGNQNVAYSDTRYKNQDNATGAAWNAGWKFRNDGVDVYTNADTHPLANKVHIGNTANGEWLKYTVNVASGGNYKLAFRVAGPDNGKYRVNDGTNIIINSLIITNTGAWGTWKTQTNNVKCVLPTGTHEIKLTMLDGLSMDLAWIEATAYTNLLLNPELGGTGLAPTNWSQWNDTQHDPDTNTYISAGNSWAFWYDGGIYQERTVGSGFAIGDKLVFGARARTPSSDKLRNGTKYGVVQLEFYKNTTLQSTVSSPQINSNSVADTWINLEAVGVVPSQCTKVRIVIRCNNFASGDGRFMMDDAYIR